MGAHDSTDALSAVSRVEGLLTWIGGGHWQELGERHERSAHAVAGAVVLFGTVLAWLAAGLAVSGSARWPLLPIAALALLFGLLVGAVIRGTAAGANRGIAHVAGRAAVAAAIGVVVGELAALVVLSSSIDHRLDERALRNADSTPAVAQVSTSLQQSGAARTALDVAVEQARERQDKALIVARCEYNPTPGCPQTRITGVPGAGPETRTANDLLSDAQRELDDAMAARDRQAPELDATISREEHALGDARQGVVANAGRGLGARWVAMNDLTMTSTGTLALRALVVAFSVLVYLLPLILAQWRGETTHDRHAVARAERERAELDADTAIAIKRAEIRREAEILWAEHQLTQARLAIEAQTQIDRERQRRRVLDTVESSAHPQSQRTFEPAHDDIYLPIAAEAEAASRALTSPPAVAENARTETTANLPARAQPDAEIEPRRDPPAPSIPSIPDATRAAARWIRPLVPPFVSRVIDNTTQPLRAARHVFEEVFEEVEEITFSLKRTHKVSVQTDTAHAADRPHQSAPAEQVSPGGRIDSSRVRKRSSTRGPVAAADAGHRAVEPPDHDTSLELVERESPHELDAPDGPRQLPPAR